MTPEAFFKELKGLGTKWKIAPDGKLRCARGDCPLAAVQRGRGASYPFWAPGDAAAILGLSEGFAEQIVGISDGREQRLLKTAQQLFQACRIKTAQERS